MNATAKLTSDRTLWEQQGAAASRRGEPRTAPAGLRLVLRWAWLDGYDRAAQAR